MKRQLADQIWQKWNVIFISTFYLAYNHLKIKSGGGFYYLRMSRLYLDAMFLQEPRVDKPVTSGDFLP